MRFCRLVFTTAFMSLAIFTAEAHPPLALLDESLFNSAGSAISGATNPPPQPVAGQSQDKIFYRAYEDVMHILGNDNECSEFFGGVDHSVDVFNRLMSKVRKSFEPVAVGIRMSGQTTTVLNARTKREYRLFQTVEINANGPFYRKRVSLADPSVPRIAGFQPNTKEARALMLLHELGHAVKGRDGNWLLPNDGHDEGLSRSNSLKVEEVCGDEIKNLRKPEAKFANAQAKPEATIAAPLKVTQP